MAKKTDPTKPGGSTQKLQVTDSSKQRSDTVKPKKKQSREKIYDYLLPEVIIRPGNIQPSLGVGPGVTPYQVDSETENRLRFVGEQETLKDFLERSFATGSLVTSPLPPLSYAFSVLGSGIDLYDAYNEYSVDNNIDGSIQLTEAILGLIPYAKRANDIKNLGKWVDIKKLKPLKDLNSAVDGKDVIDPNMINLGYKYGGETTKNMAKKKKLPKKIFGGLAGFDTLFQGLQGSDPSQWMSAIGNYAGDRGMQGFGDLGAMQDWAANTIGVNQKWRTIKEGQTDQLMGLLGTLQNLLPKDSRQSYNPQNFMVSPTRGYQFGGSPEADENAPVHIQAEKGEMLAFPDNRIAKVAAKKRHSGMKSDEVTEILPPGSFVASRDKKMLLSRDDMKKINFGYPAMEYNMDGTTELPKEITAADIMTSDKMTPAEIMKVIDRKFAVNDREKDAFAELAREENLSSRAPYIAALKYQTEMKKPKTAQQARYGYLIPRSQMSENPFAYKLGNEDMQFKRGGVPKADLGLLTNLINPIMGAMSGNLDLLMAPLKYNQNKKALKEMEDRGNQFFDTSNRELRALQSRQMNNLGLGTLASLAPSLLASSDFATPDRSGQFAALEAMPQSVPRAYTDYMMSQARQANRPFMQGLMRNTSNTARAMNNIGALQGNTLNTISNFSNQRAMTDLGMRQNYLQQLGALRGQVAAEDAQKANYQTNFANQRLSNIGNVGANYFNQSSNIDRSGLYSRLNLEGQRLQRTDNLRRGQLENTQSLMDAPANYFRNVMGSAQGLGGVDWSGFGQQSQVTTLPDPQGFGFTPTSGNFQFNGQNLTPSQINVIRQILGIG